MNKKIKFLFNSRQVKSMAQFIQKYYEHEIYFQTDFIMNLRTFLKTCAEKSHI